MEVLPISVFVLLVDKNVKMQNEVVARDAIQLIDFEQIEEGRKKRRELKQQQLLQMKKISRRKKERETNRNRWVDAEGMLKSQQEQGNRKKKRKELNITNQQSKHDVWTWCEGCFIVFQRTQSCLMPVKTDSFRCVLSSWFVGLIMCCTVSSFRLVCRLLFITTRPAVCAFSAGAVRVVTR